MAGGDAKTRMVWGEGTTWNTARELLVEHQPHATQVYQMLRSTPALTPAGSEVLDVLGGRVVSGPQEMATLSCSDMSQHKLDDNMACYVLGDKTKKGATEQKVYTISPQNMTKPTTSQRRNLGLKSNTKNSTMHTPHQLTALRGIVGGAQYLPGEGKETSQARSVHPVQHPDFRWR